jgi:hypothetical protein
MKKKQMLQFLKENNTDFKLVSTDLKTYVVVYNEKSRLELGYFTETGNKCFVWDLLLDDDCLYDKVDNFEEFKQLLLKYNF